MEEGGSKRNETGGPITAGGEGKGAKQMRVGNLDGKTDGGRLGRNWEKVWGAK